MAPNGKMLQCSRGWAGLAAFLVLVSGCDRAWVAYQKIQLGKPLPADNLLAIEGRVEASARAWSDCAIVHVPAVLKSWGLRAIMDDAGNVVGKYYLANDFAHWIVFRTAKYRWVMEVEVPMQAFHEPPAAWKRALTTRPADASPTDVLSYLLAVSELAEAPYPSPHRNWCFLDGVTFGIFYWWGFPPWGHGGEPEMRELADVPELFSGVTRTGYDREWKNRDGGTCRIRNLGGHRIRIESSYSGVFDTIRVVTWKKEIDERVHVVVTVRVRTEQASERPMSGPRPPGSRP